MNNRFLPAAMLFVFLLAFGFSAGNALAQNKPAAKPAQKKPASGQAKKPAAGQGKQTKPASASIPVDQMDAYRDQASQIVGFYQNTLNFLGDKRNAVKEKEVIINESYAKIFWDDKVQIEDDLDEKRLVPLYKDVQAYLTDVDFFFKSVKFSYQVQDVSVKTNDNQQTFFLVTTNRNLAGINIDGDSVNNNMVRYFEMNYDESKKELKIVSIYTTKLNEKDDLRNWWNSLSESWKAILGKDLLVSEGLPLSKVSNFMDTAAVVDGQTIKITDPRIYGLILRVIDSRDLDVSGDANITDLEAISKLSSLTSLNIANTGVTDLMPLRNINGLEVLNCSGDNVSSLAPLTYCTHMRELNISKTQVKGLSIVSLFPALEVLDISNTGISSLDSIKELTKIRDLRINNTPVSALEPIAGFVNLQLLDFSNTQVTNIDVLKNLTALQKVYFNNTKVSTLEPLASLSNLTTVYCDNTQVKKSAAVGYMLAHPGEVVIYATDELTKWWNTMSSDWKKVFSFYRTIENPPTREQLHSLVTIDSVDINGRMAITSLAPLSELAEMKKLYAANTGIDNVEPLRTLSLLQYIDINNTKVSSLEPLSGLNNLTTILADNTAVKDVLPLSGLKKLTLIQVDNTGVDIKNANEFLDKNPDVLVIFQTFENTSWWRDLSQPWKDGLLKQAGIKGTPDKFQLQQIANFEKLTIDSDPQMVTMQPALYLTRMKTLQFSDTRVSSLDPLGRMGWLRSLSFPKNPIMDLTPISGLRELVELNCENTQVEDLQPIMNLTNLEILRISGTQVKSLKYIANMRKLKVLDMYNTRISSIDVLDAMTNLQSLKIFNTKISQKKVDSFKVRHPDCEVIFY